MSDDLEAFASRMRKELHCLMVELCQELGPEHLLSVKAAVLCGEAADVVQKGRMAREMVAADYDLSKLPPAGPGGASEREPFEGE